MKAKRFISLVLAAVMVMSLAGCGETGQETLSTQSAVGEHEPITIMSANKDYSGFIEHVKSVYPEINIEIISYRGGNATQYMYDQLLTGEIMERYESASARICSLKEWEMSKTSPYYDYKDFIAEIATIQLEELGAQVTRAADGQDAVKRFMEQLVGSFDVILMDIMMPVMNGYEATEASAASQTARMHPGYPSSP